MGGGRDERVQDRENADGTITREELVEVGREGGREGGMGGRRGGVNKGESNWGTVLLSCLPPSFRMCSS